MKIKKFHLYIKILKLSNANKAMDWKIYIECKKGKRGGGGVETQRVINLLIRKITEDSSFLMNENS